MRRELAARLDRVVYRSTAALVAIHRISRHPSDFGGYRPSAIPVVVHQERRQQRLKGPVNTGFSDDASGRLRQSVAFFAKVRHRGRSLRLFLSERAADCIHFDQPRPFTPGVEAKPQACNGLRELASPSSPILNSWVEWLVRIRKLERLLQFAAASRHAALA